MKRNWFKLARDTRAATAIEYGLIAALIALVIVTALSALGQKVREPFINATVNMKA